MSKYKITGIFREGRRQTDRQTDRDRDRQADRDSDREVTILKRLESSMYQPKLT